MSSGLDNSNIFGAQADSLKRCPQTIRQTNPLDGNYQYPGHSEPDPYALSAKKQNALARTGSEVMSKSVGRQATTPSPAYALKNMPEHK